MNRLLLIVVSFVFLVSYSCIETDPVSPVPEIEFISSEIHLEYNGLDNLVPQCELIFKFTDGDADFGVYAKDTSSVFDSVKYNLFLVPYYKMDGIYYFVEFNPDEPPYYTIFYDPKLDRVGQNKTVKGTITLNIIDLPFYTDIFGSTVYYDTISYDFYIRDRAGHKSNIESTPDLGINF